MNIIITTPEPVVYKSLSTTTNRHTAEYIANELSAVIDSIGKNRCLGVVSDNAASMKKAWTILKNDPRYKDLPIAYYSCICHTLNLLVYDIFKLKNVSALEEMAKKIVKTVNNIHILKSTFVLIQKSKKEVFTTLKMPVKTRWGSVVHCLESILQNKGVLQQLAWSDDVNVTKKLGDEIQMHILEFSFWYKIDKIVDLMKPITECIKNLESDNPYVSDVFYALNDISSLLTLKLPNIEFLLNEEKTSILESFEHRKCMALRAMHYASSILDPRHRGQHLTQINDIAGVEYIFNVATAIMPEETQQIMIELAQYRSNEGLWSNNFVWSTEIKNLNPLTWWKGICGSSYLNKIAVAILSLPPSSAATERSFSTFSLIHTKKRNRLTNERAAKLLYIHQNRNNLKKSSVPKNKSWKEMQVISNTIHDDTNKFDFPNTPRPSTSIQMPQAMTTSTPKSKIVLNRLNLTSSSSEDSEEDDWNSKDFVDDSISNLSSRSDWEDLY